MSDTLHRILMGKYDEARTLSQMIVVTRIQELSHEGGVLLEQIDDAQRRIEEIKMLQAELARVLDDLPDEGALAGLVPAETDDAELDRDCEAPDGGPR